MSDPTRPDVPLPTDPLAKLSAETVLTLEEALAQMGKKEGGGNSIASLTSLLFWGAFGLEKKREVIGKLYHALIPVVDLLAEHGLPFGVCTACQRGFDSPEEYLHLVRDSAGRPYHRVCLATEEKQP